MNTYTFIIDGIEHEITAESSLRAMECANRTLGIHQDDRPFYAWMGEGQRFTAQWGIWD